MLAALSLTALLVNPSHWCDSLRSACLAKARATKGSAVTLAFQQRPIQSGVAAEQLRIHDNEEIHAVMQARTLRSSGKSREALALLSERHSKFPQDTFQVSLLTDLLIEQGRPSDAYFTVVPYCRDGALEQVLMRGIVVAAMNGERYQGASEYLKRILSRDLEPDQLAILAPRDDRPSDLLRMGYAALGLEAMSTRDFLGAKLYLRKLEELDPGNAISGQGLAELEANEGHYTIAIRMLETASTHATGVFLDGLRGRIAEAQLMRDRYGDGVKPPASKPTVPPPN